MPASLITARQLGRRIGDQWLWNNVRCEIFAGDSIALLGPSGSGKSLFLRALSLLDPLDVGELLWREKTIVDVPKFRSRCVYLQQRSGLAEGTVEEVLQVPFTFRQHDQRQFNRAQVVDWLERLNRDQSFLGKQSANLSGGEIQITSIIRALQLQPNVLLLDEPTAALDGATATLVERLVLDWLAESSDERAYVWVSHDQEQTELIAKTHWHIVDGTIQTNGDDGGSHK